MSDDDHVMEPPSPDEVPRPHPGILPVSHFIPCLPSVKSDINAVVHKLIALDFSDVLSWLHEYIINEANDRRNDGMWCCCGNVVVTGI